MFLAILLCTQDEFSFAQNDASVVTVLKLLFHPTGNITNAR